VNFDELMQKLTPRERQVVAALWKAGNSNKHIARLLGITEGTVKVHLVNIFYKLGVTSRTTLAALTIVHRDQFGLMK
jgi:two-component system NarL family response regulator/two-component system nitrate/nitrite response regulator NarL